jgi:hypothetical protein
MMRRLFWLTLGAAAGVTGYRRLTRLIQAMHPLAGRGSRRAWLAGRAAAGAGPGGVVTFLRDVRDGMDEYDARRPGPARHALEGQQFLAERGRQSGSRSRDGSDYAKDGR